MRTGRYIRHIGGLCTYLNGCAFSCDRSHRYYSVLWHASAVALALVRHRTSSATCSAQLAAEVVSVRSSCLSEPALLIRLTVVVLAGCVEESELATNLSHGHDLLLVCLCCSFFLYLKFSTDHALSYPANGGSSHNLLFRRLLRRMSSGPWRRCGTPWRGYIRLSMYSGALHV